MQSVPQILILLIILTLACSPRNPVSDAYDCIDPELRKEVLRNMEAERKKLKTLDDVKALMKKFHYDHETSGYCMGIEGVFARGLEGKCWEAALLGKWALECIGVGSRYLILKDGKRGHACVLSNDNTIFITNTEVERIVHVKTWRKAVLTYFTPPYRNIEEIK